MKVYKQTISLLVFCLTFVFLSTCYLVVTDFEQKKVIDALCLLLSASLLLLWVAVNKVAITISSFEYVMVLLIGYLIANHCIKGLLDVTLIAYLLFLPVLYFGAKQWIAKNSEWFIYCCLISLTITLVIFVAGALYYWVKKDTLPDTILLQNKSIFSVLLAAQIAMLVPLWLYIRQHSSLPALANFAMGIIMALALVVLVFTNGRAGWLGLVVAMSVYGYVQLAKARARKLYLFAGLPLLLLMVFLLMAYKPGSSSGRVLIYKVSAGMLQHNWLFGIGGGQFKAQYNQYQAHYFEQHDINSNEALLADNTFYAFNDFWQLTIENGIVGLLLLLLALSLFIRQLYKRGNVLWQNPLFTAAAISTVCIIISAFLSYPLQVLPIVYHAVICLAIMSACIGNGNTSAQTYKALPAATIVYVMVGSLLLVPLYKWYDYAVESRQAYLMERAGLRQEALHIYQKLDGGMVKTGTALFLYARCLYYTNQSQPAKVLLANAKRYYQTNDMYKLSGQIEMALQQYAAAETAYQTAVYMVPNRMVNRYDLLLFYEQQKDTVNIIKWANAIASMPVKVPSAITKSIQKKVQIILQQYK